MARSTPKTYRNQIMYCVFVRNHTPEGTFDGVKKDLDRIKALGTDIIWLMPIHPLGIKARKGSLGSPYAIRDYRTINPEFGNLEDFKALVDAIHQKGMKCIIDVVYNHTSPDSWLSQNHPEWFYRRADGSFGNRVGDWTDIIDLDYSNMDLWDYQIETLKMWAEIVDGFRCDVAPMVPVEFWLKAREEVEKVRPGCFWLAESVEPRFICYNRAQGYAAHSDCEMYQAFDLCYDYDIYDTYMDYMTGQVSLSEYTAAISRQEGMYPENYVKMRCLENHDRPRAARLVPDDRNLRNWTAFNYFQKGMAFLYAGQEVLCTHTPSLFDKDTINWNTGKDISPLLKKLGQIKRDPLMTNSSYTLQALPRDVVLAVHDTAGQKMVGIFSLRGECALVKAEVPDGIYENLITGDPIEVHAGVISTNGEPIIFKTER